MAVSVSPGPIIPRPIEESERRTERWRMRWTQMENEVHTDGETDMYRSEIHMAHLELIHLVQMRSQLFVLKTPSPLSFPPFTPPLENICQSTSDVFRPESIIRFNLKFYLPKLYVSSLQLIYTHPS
ncbi:hypothetical protein [Phaffia rhodozyma]|uniref:Uncharacterized protein n=1 Tax=Phaffia rhodozyma TaxID=264483 RepID=A0A0F7SQI6_PHARH|nr:hypothetical protein [Phaffia rhodozyma]